MTDKQALKALLQEYIAAQRQWKRRFEALRNGGLNNRSAVDMPQPADQDISIPDGKGWSETLFDGYGDSSDYHDNRGIDAGNSGIWHADFDSK